MSDKKKPEVKPSDKLLKASEEYFKQYPKVDSFWATEDAMFFLPGSKSDADAHRQTVGGQLHEIKRPAK